MGIWAWCKFKPAGLAMMVLGLVGSGCSIRTVESAVVEPTPGSVLLLETQGCGERRLGTATKISVDGEQRIVTNQHLVGGLERGTVGGARLDWAQTKVSSDVDIAQVETVSDLDGKAGLSLAKGLPAIGDAVSLLGYRDGLRLATVSAEVQVVTDGEPYGYNGEILLLSEPTVPGFSGGPVLDQDGDVVGLLMAVDRVTNLAIAVPVPVLQDGRVFAEMSEQVSHCGLNSTVK